MRRRQGNVGAFIAAVLVAVGPLSTSCLSAEPAVHEVVEHNPVALGSVMVVPETHELVMTGYVNMVEGMIELFACGPGGKTHESVFMLYADPKDVQAGLLLLGLKHGPPMPGVGQEPPTGDQIDVLIEWEQNGKRIRKEAAAMLYDYVEDKPVVHEQWIFNGSTIENGLFMAGVEESLIATYWDPWAIVNIQSERGRDDERITIHTEEMPPLHTPIRIILRPGQEQ